MKNVIDQTALPTFMNEVMKLIWAKESNQFRKCFDVAMNLEINVLVEKIYGMAHMPFYEEKYKGGMCALITTGCGYHIRNGELSGCSMCNLHNDVKLDAYMAAIRKRDVLKYAQLVRQIYMKSRGISKIRSYKEYWLSCCFLGDDQMPIEVYEELFGNNGVVIKRPLFYEFETSVASVTYEKIRQLETFVGNSGLVFRLGIEYGTEWLRQIWINKPLSDRSIKNAIDICHSRGHKVTANVILGIPALGEEASIKEFIYTMELLEKIRVDYYSISILYRDAKTLQGLVYESLAKDRLLVDVGLANGEHTGLPWLFTVIRAFEWITRNIPNYIERCGLGNFDPHIIKSGSRAAYNNQYDCVCYNGIYDALRKFAFHKDVESLHSIISCYKKDKCYSAYQQQLQRQDGRALHEILWVGNSLSRILWKEDWLKWYKQLKKELQKGKINENW